MNFVHLGIFLFKVIEDALATLRLIVVSNGKKVFGAILQFITTIIWVLLAGTVLINFMQDFWKVVAFSLGALVGSYVGSLIEEKIALGTNLFIIKLKKEKISFLINSLKSNNFDVYKVKSNNENIIVVMAARKQSYNIVKLVNSIDENSIILSEKIKIFSQP